MDMVLTSAFVGIFWKYIAVVLFLEWFVGWKLKLGMMGMLIVQMIAFIMFPIIVPYLVIIGG